MEKKQGFEHYADRRKQEFDIHVASILWEKRKNDNSGGAIDCIKIEHEETMQKVKDWLPGIKEQKAVG